MATGGREWRSGRLVHLLEHILEVLKHRHLEGNGSCVFGLKGRLRNVLGGIGGARLYSHSRSCSGELDTREGNANHLGSSVLDRSNGISHINDPSVDAKAIANKIINKFQFIASVEREGRSTKAPSRLGGTRLAPLRPLRQKICQQPEGSRLGSP